MICKHLPKLAAFCFLYKSQSSWLIKRIKRLYLPHAYDLAPHKYITSLLGSNKEKNLLIFLVHKLTAEIAAAIFDFFKCQPLNITKESTMISSSALKFTIIFCNFIVWDTSCLCIIYYKCKFILTFTYTSS